MDARKGNDEGHNASASGAASEDAAKAEAAYCVKDTVGDADRAEGVGGAPAAGRPLFREGEEVSFLRTPPCASGADMLTVDGQTHTLSEWARLTGIKKTTIKERLRRGWSIERALGVCDE